MGLWLKGRVMVRDGCFFLAVFLASLQPLGSWMEEAGRLHISEIFG